MSKELRRYAAFAVNLRSLKEMFPEHDQEIDRLMFDVGKKLESCDDPNCTCSMSFKNFRAVSKIQTEVER